MEYISSSLTPVPYSAFPVSSISVLRLLILSCFHLGRSHMHDVSRRRRRRWWRTWRSSMLMQSR